MPKGNFAMEKGDCIVQADGSLAKKIDCLTLRYINHFRLTSKSSPFSMRLWATKCLDEDKKDRTSEIKAAFSEFQEFLLEQHLQSEQNF